MARKKYISSPYLFILLLSILLDLIAIILSDITTFIIRFNGQFPSFNFQAYKQLSLFIIILRLGSFYVFHLYDKPKYKSNFEIIINSTKAVTASSVIIISFLYFMTIEAYPRSIAFLSWLITIIYTSGWRIVFKDFVSLYLGRDFFQTNLLIIGTGKAALECASYAARDTIINYHFLGFIKTSGDPIPYIKEEQVLGDLKDLEKILNQARIDEAIIAISELKEKELSSIISLFRKKKISFKAVPEVYEKVLTNTILYGGETLFASPQLFLKSKNWYWGLKRIFDILLSLLIIIALSPLMLLIAAAIKFSSEGPVFYLQKRVGKNGKAFVIYKFRTMYMWAEKGGRARWAKREDKRITPLGKILRRYRLDELPQLINVLKNEMSLIGPRPERPYFTFKLMKKFPFYSERLQVKPGISGWAQVNFKYTSCEEEVENKLLYDLFYIQNVSFTLDLLIGLKTLKVILIGKGAI